MTRSGRNNSNADALSRQPRLEEPGESIDDNIGHGFIATAYYSRWLSSAWYADIYMFLEATIVTGETQQERRRLRLRAMLFGPG